MPNHLTSKMAMTLAEVDKIAAALKSLSVSIVEGMELPEGYTTLGRDVEDASEALRDALRKSTGLKTGRKQKKSRQTSLPKYFLGKRRLILL